MVRYAALSSLFPLNHEKASAPSVRSIRRSTYVVGCYSVVSGGYDSQLIHFDASLGTVLTRLDVRESRQIASKIMKKVTSDFSPLAAPPSTGDSPISLSPPFLLSIAINSNGVLAAATADGRVIVGRGGERGPGDRSNRRKWHGLNADMVDQYHIAEGPVVGM